MYLLPPSSKHWDYRLTPPFLILGTELRASYVLGRHYTQ